MSQNNVKPQIIALDGSGFTSDYADKYYAKIRGKKKKKAYTKNHITIDANSRLILHYQAIKGPKHDTQFATAAIKKIKKYKPKNILADKAYDTEHIRKTINEEIKAKDQIPLKNRAKKGKYRLKSKQTFHKPTYNLRNNVESVFSVIKRIFRGVNASRSTHLANKETKLKDVLYNGYRTIQLRNT